MGSKVEMGCTGTHNCDRFCAEGHRGARETTGVQEGVTRGTTEGFGAGMRCEPRLHESTWHDLQVVRWARCGFLGRSECAAELNARRRVASTKTSECSAVLNGVFEKDAATLPNGAMNSGSMCSAQPPALAHHVALSRRSLRSAVCPQTSARSIQPPVHAADGPTDHASERTYVGVPGCFCGFCTFGPAKTSPLGVSVWTPSFELHYDLVTS